MELIWLLISTCYLVVVPIAVFILFARNNANKKRIHQLTKVVIKLKDELQVLRDNAIRPTDQSAQVDQPASPTTSGVAPSYQAAAVVTPAAVAVDPLDVAAAAAVPIPESMVAASATTAPAPRPPVLEKIAPRQAAAAATDSGSGSGILSSLLRWFFAGNPLAKLGVVILFFGLAYLAKYSIDNVSFPPELRLAFSAALGLVLLLVGWRLRQKNNLFALILQGAAVGTLYITVFAAIKIFALPLNASAALAIMVVICAASVLLALVQNALSLALLASLGGYLAPILLSDGTGDYRLLFSYYLILSLGILAISIKQSWRELNLLGLLFSFGVGWFWGVGNYSQNDWLQCQLFLVANIIIFGVVAVLLALNHQAKGKKVIEAVLFFVPPLFGFLMQYYIVQHWQYGASFAALGFGAFYLLLGYYALRQVVEVGARLASFALALGAGFVTMAVPLTFSAQWTAVIWLFEGLALIWAGLVQKQYKMAHGGSILMLLSTLSALHSSFDGFIGRWYFKTELLPLFVLSAAAFILVDWLWQRYAKEQTVLQQQIRRGWLLVLVGINWAIAMRLLCLVIMPLSAFALLERLMGVNTAAALQLLLLLLSALVWQAGAKKLHWSQLGSLKWLLWLGVLVFELSLLDYRGLDQALPVAALGLWGLFWLSIFATLYYLLRQASLSQQPQWLQLPLQLPLHLSAFFLLLLALNWYVYELIFPYISWGQYEWRFVIVAALNIGLIAGLISLVQRQVEPFFSQANLYQKFCLPLLVALLFLLLLRANFMDGQIVGWYFIPIINPLEITALCALVFLARLYLQNRRNNYSYLSEQLMPAVNVAALGLVFLWGNGILLRSIAYITELPWNGVILWQSAVVQTAASLAWTLTAVVFMFLSVRRGNRKLWLAGMALLVLTVAKLFLVDGWTQGLWRAITFIAVALLLLLIGYLAPIPPKQKNPLITQRKE